MRKIELKEAFKIANAIGRLEGYEPSPAVLAMQERVGRGELSIDDAIAEVKRRASTGDASTSAAA